MSNQTTAESVDLDFLKSDSVSVAAQLLGWRFYHADAGGIVGGTIVETEAYSQQDAASHSYKGKTPRTQVMFGPSGHVYVYFTYGMHYCVNFVTGQEGAGEAVLIRAIIPEQGIDRMRTRRHNSADNLLTNGPAKICQALNINLTANGERLNSGEFLLLPPTQQIRRDPPTKRIGISKDTHRLWRFTCQIVT